MGMRMRRRLVVVRLVVIRGRLRRKKGKNRKKKKKKKKKKAKKKKKKEDNGDHIKPSGAVTRYANFLVKKPIFCYSLSTFMMFFFGFIG